MLPEAHSLVFAVAGFSNMPRAKDAELILCWRYLVRSSLLEYCLSVRNIIARFEGHSQYVEMALAFVVYGVILDLYQVVVPSISAFSLYGA